MLVPVVVQLPAGIEMAEVGLRPETKVMPSMVAETELVRSKLMVFVPGGGVTEEVMLAVGVLAVDKA